MFSKPENQESLFPIKQLGKKWSKINPPKQQEDQRASMGEFQQMFNNQTIKMLLNCSSIKKRKQVYKKKYDIDIKPC